MQITGIVLAGGKSSRMGTDKCWLQLPDKSPMILKIIKTLQQAGASQIIISANSQKYLDLGYSVVNDEYKSQGPLAGIFSALNQSQTQINLLSPCDTPLIDFRLYRYLLNFADDYQVVLPADEQRIYPLNAVVNRNVIPHLQQALEQGRLKVLDVFKDLKTKIVPVQNLDFYTPEIFTNINSRQDYEQLVSRRF